MTQNRISLALVQNPTAGYNQGARVVRTLESDEPRNLGSAGLTAVKNFKIFLKK